MFMSVQWKSMGSNIVLDPTDLHCMDKKTLKHSSDYLILLFFTEEGKSNKIGIT